MVGLVLAAAVAGQIPTPPPFDPQQPQGSFLEFGPVQPTTLEEILHGRYDRKAVRVKGTLGPLETLLQAQYFELRDFGSVVLIPVPELLHDVPRLMGRRVEVVGFVRRLVREQGYVQCDIPPRPASYCADPTLPPTPDLTDERATWPMWSITLWSILDQTPLGPRKEDAGRLSDAIGTLGEAGRAVHVRGRFCGTGLCGASPGPAPHASAWLLQDGEERIWVLGKAPRGKGWRLDPTYAPDSRRWLEVEGRLETCGAALCLRAKRVSLSPAPGVARDR